MPHAALQLELEEQESPGIWPWVIGLAALILLAITVSQSVQSIPQSLSRQAQSVLPASLTDSVQIAVSGRDLTLTGTVPIDLDRDALVRRIAGIDGVRVVRDSMATFDPAKQALQRRQAFRQALSSINLSSVSFEPGSASLTNESARALTRVVQVMTSYPDYRIRIAGHTDNTGRLEVNLRISRERARAVSAYLTSRGVKTSQVIAQGYGSTKPIADNSTEAGRALNRRIEITYVD